MREMASERDFMDLIEKSFASFQKLFRMRRAGLLPDDECERRFRKELWKSWHHDLESRGVRTAFHDDTWAGFLGDYLFGSGGRNPAPPTAGHG